VGTVCAIVSLGANNPTFGGFRITVFREKALFIKIIIICIIKITIVFFFFFNFHLIIDETDGKYHFLPFSILGFHVFLKRKTFLPLLVFSLSSVDFNSFL